MTFARSEFRLSKPGEDGVPLREKLGKARANGLQKLPQMPTALEHVWHWFRDLSFARTSNGFGPNPITYAEIAAWRDLTLAMPNPWEVSLLKRLDRAYLEEMSK